MGDNIPVSGLPVSTDEITTKNGAVVPAEHVQRMKVGFGVDGALQDVTPAAPLPVGPSVTFGAGAADATTQRVTLASDGPAVTALTAIDADLGSPDAPAAPPDASGNVNIIAGIKRALLNWAALLPRIPAALGSQTKASSFSVTFASDQDAATGSYQAAGNNLLALIDGDIGAPSSAVATSDTGAFSVISLIKRGLQNWTNLMARLPAALGQMTMAGSWPVALASDQAPIADASATGNITTQNLVPAGVATAGSAVTLATGGRAGLSIQVTGVYTGALSMQGTVDGGTWVTVGGVPLQNINSGANSATIASALQSIFQAEIAAFSQVRVTALAAVTGTATVTLRASVGTALVGIDAPIPTGANNIGNVAILAGNNNMGNLTRGSGFTDSSTPLGSAAAFTGTGRATTGANYPWFVASAYADQAGTLLIERSVDTGATYRVVNSVALAAGDTKDLAARVTGASGTATLYRVRFVNGATAQGAFQLSSSFTAA